MKTYKWINGEFVESKFNTKKVFNDGKFRIEGPTFISTELTTEFGSGTRYSRFTNNANIDKSDCTHNIEVFEQSMVIWYENTNSKSWLIKFTDEIEFSEFLNYLGSNIVNN